MNLQEPQEILLLLTVVWHSVPGIVITTSIRRTVPCQIEALGGTKIVTPPILMACTFQVRSIPKECHGGDGKKATTLSRGPT